MLRTSDLVRCLRRACTLAVAVILTIACSSNRTGVAEDQMPACTMGPRYAEDASFPYPGYSYREEVLPRCPVRCGAVGTADGIWTMDLPSGACSGEPLCSVLAVLPCPSQSELTPGLVGGFECRCASGAWSCVLATPGGPRCPLPPWDDGGAKAEGDAGAPDGAGDADAGEGGV